jgi:hypothetical protein
VRLSVMKAESHALSLMEERNDLTNKIKQVLHQRIVLQEKGHNIHDETGTLFSTLRRLGALDEYESHEAIEEKYLSQISIMYEYFEQSSRRQLKERFKTMRQNIDMTLTSKNNLSSITFSFPNWKRNPSATNLFFTMVEQHLWEGSSIVKKQGTITISSLPTLNAFEDLHDWKLVVRDVSSPGVKFSLCFKGLGPSFFITLKDDTPETCFGEVINNREMLEDMQDSAEILSMKIIPMI